MTNELKRLRQALGAPDFQLHEIQREQRLMEASSRWPILRDVAPDTTAPNREINVSLDVAEAEKPAEPSIVRLQTKSAPATKKAALKTARKKSASKGASKSAQVDEAAGQTTGQLSNVFLRLKHLKKAKDGPGDDKIAVV